jgi:tripartite-type tricarboxylate transporter receptor subunit TctC
VKISRRRFLDWALGTAALPTVSRFACAQAYPIQPVRIVVGFGPGGASDILARLVGQWLSERLHQPFIIENRPGAGTNIATEAVTRAPADGHTLLLISSTNVMNIALYEKLNFDFIRDIAPVASIAFNPGVMEVNPSFPTKTIPEFIAYAKDNPGKIAMATSGSGSPPHIWGELFKMMASVDLIAVPYRAGSGPALTDLMAGQVQVTFDPLLSSIEFIKAGKLRALGVTTATRSSMLPEIPAVNEFVPGYEAAAWLGIGAPKNTPPWIIEKLNQEVNAALNDPKMRARLADLGGTPLVNSPIDFARLIANDAEKWGKVIRTANIKLD